MWYIYIFPVLIFCKYFNIAHSIPVEEQGRHFGNTIDDNENLGRRRRPSSGFGGPCNSNRPKGGVYKTDGEGRTFFDFSYVNVEHNNQYNINCGGQGGGHRPLGGNRPILGGGNNPHFGGHRPLLGGTNGHRPTALPSGEHNNQNGGFLSNRPLLSMIIANRPLQGLFSGFSQSQSQSQPGQSQSQTGIFHDVFTGFSSLLPSPQEFGQGLGDGISSFVQTIPQIGQSFQSLLPNFDNFQLPSFPQGTGGGTQPSGTVPSRPTPTVPPTVSPLPTPTTIDPDDIIYNDDVKPVHEDLDPITDPYNSKLPQGINQYYRPNRYPEIANRNKYYQQYNSGREHRTLGRNFGDNSFADSRARGQDYRQEGRGFKFPE